ncbi:glycosyltransferase family 2 protein [Psychrosphaera aestuarii]|uniref:glycosyltransferase family 2 protein n=1 Tax=Psychrosphaera aestuarii TaxID=1266052 RepID=UPI001B326184|nr:glycosyltransferase family 2 protein [Psychrosphaera aestuarii]
MEVDILLSTYNGEQYLEEQLISLSNQKSVLVNLIVRDDCSSDGTVDVLNNNKFRFNKVLLVESNGVNFGSSRSFFELLKYSSADYIFFCDQDDVWCSEKCEIQIKSIASIGLKKPAGVFSDMALVDESLRMIGMSLLSSQRMNPNHILKYKEGIFAQNPVAGCSLCINAHAKELILKINQMPNKIVHDHWFACIIRLNGNLIFLDRQLVLYRQHSQNQIGNKIVNIKYFLNKMTNIAETLRQDSVLVGFGKKHKDFSFFRYLYLKITLNFKRLKEK